MKIIKLAIVCAFTTICAQAYASGYEVCRAYEFEELKTFSTDELQAKFDEYKSIYDRIGAVPPQTAREVQEDFNDQQKCSSEMERLKRLINARAKAESKAKPTSKNNSKFVAPVGCQHELGCA